MSFFTDIYQKKLYCICNNIICSIILETLLPGDKFRHDKEEIGPPFWSHTFEIVQFSIWPNQIIWLRYTQCVLAFGVFPEEIHA